MFQFVSPLLYKSSFINLLNLINITFYHISYLVCKFMYIVTESLNFTHV